MALQRLSFAGRLAGAFCALLLAQCAVTAAEIRSGVSSRETYVGKPVILQFQFVNANDHQPPEIPEVEAPEVDLTAYDGLLGAVTEVAS